MKRLCCEIIKLFACYFLIKSLKKQQKKKGEGGKRKTLPEIVTVLLKWEVRFVFLQSKSYI